MHTRFIIILISLLAIAPGAEGQILWKHRTSDVWLSSDSNIDSSLCFTSLSCYDNNCIAAGLVLYPLDIPTITFFLSNDGGISWLEHRPAMKFPAELTNDGITKIQQIDSENAVAMGSPGIILITTDGGKSWQRRDCPVARLLKDVSFSDPLTGIVATVGADSVIFTTFDGGKHWINNPVDGYGYFSCHSYGGGKFRYCGYARGPVYTTNNNFLTVDSTKEIFDSLSDPKHRFVITRFHFGKGDTIYGVGGYWPKDTNNAFGSYGVIMRTINGGKSWEKPFVFPTPQLDRVKHVSSLDRDTILAGGGDNNHFLISTDRGATWKADSIRIDTNYETYACYGITMSGDGHPVAIFSPLPSPPIISIIARGDFVKESVEYVERIIYMTHLYPNPTSDRLTIESIDRSKAPVHIMDILGREVMNGILSNEGKTTLNVSELPKGIYDVVLNSYGKVFSVGKVAVVGK